ncbi:MAG: thiamine phosphate synthase [Candidatus Omnitrophota bacterium]
MKPKKRLLKKSRLYIIIDKKIAQNNALGLIAKKLRDSSVDIIQLRDKHSKKSRLLKEALELRRIFLNSAKLFLINDYPDIAKICGADGVHLGQRDLPVKAARKMLGEKSIIGKSCHSLRQAVQAQKEGADYIGMGPVFPTQTKAVRRKRISPELIQEVNRRLKIPVFAVGGITTDNLGQLLIRRIRRVVVCGAILRAKNITLKAEAFYRQLALHR